MRAAKFVGVAFITLFASGCMSGHGSRYRDVLRSPHVYVGGHVERPGAYELPAAGLSLRQVLTDAGAKPSVPGADERVLLGRVGPERAPVHIDTAGARHYADPDVHYDIAAAAVHGTDLGAMRLAPGDQVVYGKSYGPWPPRGVLILP